MITLTYAGLMLLLGLSLWARGAWSFPIALLKALLVGAVFMELRQAPRLLLLLGLGALVWVGFMFALTLGDYWTR